MTVVIRPEAIEELLASARWYNQRQGLGDALIDEAWMTLGRIQATPAALGRYECYQGPDEVRRATLARFPYSVIFVIVPDGIGVLAFAPNNRRPVHWLSRLR